MARVSEGELLVRIGKIWHRVRDARACFTRCDRSYDPQAELTTDGVGVGDLVCAACWDVERIELQ